MPNYIADFQDATVGAGIATGWTNKWEAATYSVILEGSDKILSRASQGSNVRTAATRDAVDSDADRDDCEVLLNIRLSAISTQTLAGAVVRLGGTSSATANGYACESSVSVPSAL